MSDNSSEEGDQMEELQNISESSESVRFSSVSGWDDDTEGIEDERNPEGTISEVILIFV